jgi:putative glutathione S-transferase
MISVSVVAHFMYEDGWVFDQTSYPARRATVCSAPLPARHLYIKADPGYSGRVTVPVLWDKKRETIVSNESAEIIRMFNSAFDGLDRRPATSIPAGLRGEIDAINELVYPNVNNGVYRSGFATTQDAYEEAVADAVRQRSTRSRKRLSRQPLSRRRPADRGRLASVHDAGALRSGLCRPFQVQHPPHRRLSEPVGLHCASSTRCPGSRRR